MEPKQLVEYVVKALVDHPNDVKINEVEGERSTILELKVKPEDIGKVIGKNGRIAHSLRTILNAAVAKSGKRVMLEILNQRITNQR